MSGIAVLRKQLGPDSRPGRLRVLRRKSMRSAVASSATLASIVSVVAACQILATSTPLSGLLTWLALGQALLAAAVALSTRTRLYRRAGAIVFGFLLLVPLVPLATLRVQPETVALVVASLALIPIVVALFIPWTSRTFVMWTGSYVLVVACLTFWWDATSLTGSDGWRVVTAVMIGATFGLVGQVRQDRQDSQLFARDVTLRRLYSQSTLQQTALSRVNGELDRLLRREVQSRESIEAALTRIQPGTDPERVASDVCAELVRLPLVDSAWIIAIAPDSGQVLAQQGALPWSTRGREISSVHAREMFDRASHGPWADTGGLQHQPRDLDDGPQPLAWLCAPLRGRNGVLGVIGCGTQDPDQRERIVEMLSAITTYGSVVGALLAPGLEARTDSRAAHSRIDDIVAQASYRPWFQPIVDLTSGRVVGYEALTRFDDGTPPDVVFDAALRAGLTLELEMATATAAISASRVLPKGAYIAINASPDLLGSQALAPLLRTIDRPVIVEVTEHTAIDDYAALRSSIQALGTTVRVAVDDAGAGYSSLRHILELKPDIAKLDLGLIRGIDRDPARQALIAGVRFFARDQGMSLVAEGVETPAELATVIRLEIDYGQGYLLGRPMDGRAKGVWPSRIDLASRASTEPARRVSSRRSSMAAPGLGVRR